MKSASSRSRRRALAEAGRAPRAPSARSSSASASRLRQPERADVGGLAAASRPCPRSCPASRCCASQSSTSSTTWNASPIALGEAVELRQLAPRSRRSPQRAPSSHRGADQRAGLVDVHELELGQRQRLADGLEVDRLPARHAARAGGHGEDLAPSRAAPRGSSASRCSASSWNARLCSASPTSSAVASSNSTWHGGLAAAQHVVVHAGQVVVHQRIGVDQLDRGAGDLAAARARAAGHLAGGERQQRPHALAAAEHGIAHRLVQARRRDVAGGQQPRQRRFHARLDARIQAWKSASISFIVASVAAAGEASSAPRLPAP